LNEHYERKGYCGLERGKDSAFALYETQAIKRFEVVALLTTMTQDNNRISTYGVHRSLLEQQANALWLPLEKMSTKKSASNAEYEKELLKTPKMYVDQGIDSGGVRGHFLGRCTTLP
jgi:diphthamide synthase (EF-2-diphthine--ammonia ligase)